jgi:hypothetical protein
MQSVLPLTPGHPLRNVTGLARQISLPGEHAPMRFPSFPALERTALMGFNQPATLVLPASTPVSMTLFRSATYPVWADQSLSLFYAMIVRTEYQPARALSSQGNVTYTPQTAYTRQVLNNKAATTGSSKVSGVANNAAMWPMLGRDGPGLEYVYVPDGCWFSFVVVQGAGTSNPGATSAVVDFELWLSPGQTTSGQSLVTILGAQTGGMSVSQQVSTGTWIRFSALALAPANANDLPNDYYVGLYVANVAFAYIPSGVDTGEVSMIAASSRFHWPLVNPVEFSNSALPWYAARTTAVAVLGTNVSQVLNKGGTILGGRVSPAVLSPWQVTQSYINGLHPAEKAFLPLESGIYTYAPPSTDIANFFDYTINTGGGASAGPRRMLSNDALYNKVYITATAVEEQLACTVSWHIEFRTSSALFQVGMSAMPLEALHSAQLLLAELGFFFENPDHDRLLNRVTAGAKKYVPQLVGMVNPVAGKLLQSMVSRLSAKSDVKPKAGPKTPKGTSVETLKSAGEKKKQNGKGKPSGKPKPKKGKK